MIECNIDDKAQTDKQIRSAIYWILVTLTWINIYINLKGAILLRKITVNQKHYPLQCLSTIEALCLAGKTEKLLKLGFFYLRFLSIRNGLVNKTATCKLKIIECNYLIK